MNKQIIISVIIISCNIIYAKYSDIRAIFDFVKCNILINL